jgi:glycosyltransferase involved in cell wall biosynthesis
MTSAAVQVPPPRTAGPLVSFLVPVHNEERTLARVLDAIAALPLEHEIIVVDDGSTDGTAAVLEAWRAGHPTIVVLTQAHRGKGAALRAAIPHASGDIVVVQDGDLEYDPGHVPGLVAPIARGEADVVFGSRLLAGTAERTWATPNRLGNQALSALTGLLYLRRVTDMETGHKAFAREVLQAMDLRSDDFAIEPEITAHVLRRGLRLVELPIPYVGRSHAEGKKIRWRDARKAVAALLVNRFRPLG